MMITFYKTEADGSIRYYSVHNRQPHFFSKYSFTSIYGMNQRSGRERVYTFKTRREMDAKMKEIFEDRVIRGYKVLYSYARNKKYIEMFEEVSHMTAG
jgi:hypothetical protein